MMVGSGIQPHPAEIRYDGLALLAWIFELAPRLKRRVSYWTPDFGGAALRLVLSESSVPELKLFEYLSRAKTIDAIPERTKGQLILDFRRAELCLQVNDLSLISHPWSFSNDLKSKSITGLDFELTKALYEFGVALWPDLISNFEEYLRAGDWILMGRIGSPIATDFEQVPFDVWKQLKVEDWLRGVASTDREDKIYSIHAGVPQMTESEFREQYPGAMSKIRTLPRRQSVFEAIRMLWPDRVPSIGELPNKALVGKVQEWCSSHKHVIPSSDTILRAAGRRGKL